MSDLVNRVSKEVGYAVAHAGLRLRNIFHHKERVFISLDRYSRGTALKLGTCIFACPAGCGRVAGSNPSLEEQNE